MISFLCSFPEIHYYFHGELLMVAWNNRSVTICNEMSSTSSFHSRTVSLSLSCYLSICKKLAHSSLICSQKTVNIYCGSSPQKTESLSTNYLNEIRSDCFTNCWCSLIIFDFRWWKLINLSLIINIRHSSVVEAWASVGYNVTCR